MCNGKTKTWLRKGSTLISWNSHHIAPPEQDGINKSYSHQLVWSISRNTWLRSRKTFRKRKYHRFAMLYWQILRARSLSLSSVLNQWRGHRQMALVWTGVWNWSPLSVVSVIGKGSLASVSIPCNYLKSWPHARGTVSPAVPGSRGRGRNGRGHHHLL